MTSTPLTLPPDSPFGRIFLPLIALSLGGLYFLTRSPLSPFLLSALAGILGIGLLPGLALTLHLDHRFGLWSSWILPLMLSPVLVTAVALVVGWFGAPLEPVPAWVVLASTVALIFAPQPQREIEDWAVSLDAPSLLRPRFDRQQVLLLATVVLALLGPTLIFSAWLSGGGPALFHGEVSRAVFLRLPPEDPLAAGLPLRDFWAFHVYLALLEECTGAEARSLLAGGSLIGAFVLVFAAYRLLTRLGSGHARALWGVVFLFFGMGGLAWATAPALAALGGGSPPAWSENLRALSAVRPVVSGEAGFPAPTTFFFQPFLLAGPFALSLVYFVLFLLVTVGSMGERRRSRIPVAAFAALGMLLFHAGTGAVALAATLAAAPAVLFVSGLRPLRRPGSDTLFWLGAAALAALAAGPYLQAVTAAGGIDPRAVLGLSWRKSLVLLVSALPMVALGIPALVSFLASPDPRRQAWAVWSVVALAVLQCADFGGAQGIDGPLYLLHFILALSAGSAVPTVWNRLRAPGRALFAVAIVLVLVPRSVMGLAAYLGAEDPRDLRPAEREAADWIARSTEPRAILVDTGPDLGFAAHRPLLLGDRARLLARGYRGHDVTLRNLAYHALLAGAPLTDGQAAALRALEAPIYFVNRPAGGVDFPPPAHATRVFANDAVTLYRWEPAEAGNAHPPGDGSAVPPGARAERP